MELNDDELGAVAGGQGGNPMGIYTVYCKDSKENCDYSFHYADYEEACRGVQQYDGICPKCKSGKLYIRAGR